MQVFSSLTELKNSQIKYKNLALALGTFDGVHIGHQNVILKAVKLAKQNDGTSAVFTFKNHPLSVLAQKKVPPFINDTVAKVNDIASLGVDVLINIEFTKEISTLSPKEFMQMLKNYLAPKFVVTGPNYTFGAKGAGTPQTLAKEGKTYGFESYMYHFVYCESNMVSSTAIRKAILEGDLDIANKMLGKSFAINEEVIHGKKRGRTLGYPTANLNISEERIMLPNGVYIVYAYVDGIRYDAIASIGTNPTFKDISRRVEVNIFNFNQDIYGKLIQVNFLKAIRHEIKFSSVEALLTQMKKDVKTAKNYFKKL